MTDTRPCTCAPDERPYPCQHQYALGLCRKAEIRSLRAELDRCIAQIGDLAKLRSEEEVAHGHVMGRIAIALFGEQNNRTDEECVTKVAEVVRERDNAVAAVDANWVTHQQIVAIRAERDALAAENLTLRNAAINASEQYDALAALLRRIIDSYNAYRRRGVAPAPTEYADVVRAIVLADAALAAKEVA